MQVQVLSPVPNFKRKPSLYGIIFIKRENADPLFAYLATEKPFVSFGKGIKNSFLKKFGDKAYIKWNFTKFLVNKEGSVMARFEPTEDMEKVRSAVLEELSK